MLQLLSEMLKQNIFRQSKKLTSIVLAVQTTEICLTIHEEIGHRKTHIILDNVIDCYLNVNSEVYI